MPLMTRIPSDLAAFGLTVELVPGWETRSAGSFAPAGVTCHWTAGPKDAKGRPSLNVVVNGREGLPGPLCNVYLGRDGTCVVVAAGRANHAGEGGYKGLVGNSAVYGIEAECAGDADWTPAQKKIYPRLVAALLHGLGRDASWSMGHNEWAPTRKIDIRDIMPEVRSGAAAILSGSAPSEEDELMAAADDIAYIKGLLSWAFDPTLGTGPAFSQPGELTKLLGGIQYALFPEDGVNSQGEMVKRIRAIHGLVSDPAAFAEAVAARLPANGNGGGLTRDDVKGAIRDVLGSLDAA